MIFNFQLIYLEEAFVSSPEEKAEVNFCDQNLPLSRSIVVIPFLTFSFLGQFQAILAQTIFGKVQLKGHTSSNDSIKLRNSGNTSTTSKSYSCCLKVDRL